MKYQSDTGNDLALLLAATSVVSDRPRVGGDILTPRRAVTVQIPALSLSEWQKQEPERFIGYREQSEAGFLRERGDDNACFEFTLTDSSPSADWFRPSARESAWFFAQGHSQALGILGADVLIETSSSVLLMSHFYIREDRVLLKAAEGKLAFVLVPAGDILPSNVYSVWRRRLWEN